jgi:ribosome-associated toxin RatA of RatAB toxin-antitoxin module
MSTLGGTASAEIDAPIATVWAIVEDVLSSPDWQGGVVSMEALETDGQGRPTLVEAVNDAKVRHIKTQVRFSYDGPTSLRWSQEKGDLKSLDGSWTLEDVGGGRTRATYALEGHPGRMLGMLVRGPVEDSIRKHLVEARPEELRRRVEGG